MYVALEASLFANFSSDMMPATADLNVHHFNAKAKHLQIKYLAPGNSYMNSSTTKTQKNILRVLRSPHIVLEVIGSDQFSPFLDKSNTTSRLGLRLLGLITLTLTNVNHGRPLALAGPAITLITFLMNQYRCLSFGRLI
jgi:hypothetical protein